jgi:hypothetical protein
MAFKGQITTISNILVYYTRSIVEQVNMFTCLGCKISYEEEKDVTSKIINLLYTFWSF